ncbi:MAG TPA: hypothetical protein VJ953_00810 [Saprospiraceae bacterium]|nr:hypothetical protein [Saprospiraceae bacterium]
MEIKRFEVNTKFENEDHHTFVGTETLFEVKKKWKGSNRKIVSIFQDGSSCSEDFLINGYDWIISARNTSFTFTPMREQMKGKYLQTIWCDPNVSQGEEEFDLVEQKLDQLFPNQIKLKKRYDGWFYSLFMVWGVMVVFLIYKRLQRG